MIVLAVLVSIDAPVISIIAITILAACFSSFFGPAIGSYLPTVVGDERDLGPANSLWATLDNLAYFIGPAIAGILIASGGLGFAFLLNALSFGFVAVVLMTLPPGRPTATPPEVAPDSPEAEQVVAPVAGAQRVSQLAIARRIAGALVVDASTSFAGMGLSILLVLVAVDQLQAGPQAVGYLEAATGIGGVVAGIMAGWFVAKRLDVPLVVSGIVAAMGLVLLSLTGSLAVALVVVGVAIGAVLVMDIVVTTAIQRQIPDELRGRAMGLLQLSGVTAALLGSLLAPLLASVVGLGVVLAGMGLVLVVAGVLGAAMLRRGGALQAQLDIDPARIDLLRRTILAGAPSAQLEIAARQMTSLAVTAGEAVVTQGHVADRFYLIADGRFRVSQTGDDGQEHVLREIGPADPFGEIGLLTGSPRTATVTAVTDGHLFALEKADFLALVGQGPELSNNLLNVYRGSTARG
jgi:ENTS family enterobactin (siderophore) exporter